jgi:hypothetical protein
MPVGGTQSISVSHSQQNSSGSWTWSSNGDKLTVSYDGKFEFTDDDADADVRWMAPGSSLKISDGRWFGRHSVELRERNGQIERSYYVNASSRPYEPEGRLWLQQNLPRFVRNTGIGAEARVARMLKSGGPGAVLAEISRIDGTHAKGIYFRHLFKQGTLTADQYRQAFAQAGREMRNSSYDLAQLLITAADQLPEDAGARAAWFQAAGGISSDYDLRRVYSTVLQRGPVSPAILNGVLTNARSIESNYDMAELLRLILSKQAIDATSRAAFFAALETIDGSYDRRRVLSAVVGQRPGDPSVIESSLVAAAGMRSSHDTAEFLLDVLRQHGIEGARGPFFAAVDTINGNYDKGRVLQAVVRKAGTSPETLRDVLRAARSMNGYDLSQLLKAIAANHSIGGDLRDAYLTAAERLGEYDQNQAMAALVRSERRK